MNTMPFVEILDPLEKMFIKKNSKTNQQLMIENLIFAEKQIYQRRRQTTWRQPNLKRYGLIIFGQFGQTEGFEISQHWF